MMSRPPIVLVFAGLDPTNGAGLGADLESVRAAGGWSLSVPTALTVQDSHNVASVQDIDSGYIRTSARHVIDDIVPDAIKVGLISSLAALEAVADIIAELPSLPVVIDPVLKAGGGTDLSSGELVKAFRDILLPLATVITPNRQELARLVPEAAIDDDRARVILEQQVAVLATGTDPLEGESIQGIVEHSLYRPDHAPIRWQWPRLPGSYHGSGCTLASRLALELAIGTPLEKACELAQSSTWLALKNAYRLGSGQYMPQRLFPQQYGQQ